MMEDGFGIGVGGSVSRICLRYSIVGPIPPLDEQNKQLHWICREGVGMGGGRNGKLNERRREQSETGLHALPRHNPTACDSSTPPHQ